MWDMLERMTIDGWNMLMNILIVLIVARLIFLMLDIRKTLADVRATLHSRDRMPAQLTAVEDRMDRLEGMIEQLAVAQGIEVERVPLDTPGERKPGTIRLTRREGGGQI